MSSAAWAQTNLSGGEFGKRFQGRIDTDRYATGLAKCTNWIIPLQGCAYRRPGTKFVALAGDQTSPSVLIPFEFSTTQAYVIEFGHLFIRFYRNGEQITSGGTPVEVVSPYDESDLYELYVCQSLDVLYIVHPGYAPRKLTRSSHTSWTLTTIDFIDGPYLDQNPLATTLSFTGTGVGLTVTVTASAPTFATTDVDRLIRFFAAGTWGWLKINGFISNTQVTAVIRSALGGAGPGTTWHLGVWSATTGYPACLIFHQDRLVFAGSLSFPQRMDFSTTSDYENMAPSKLDASVIDTNAIVRSLNSDDVQDIRWVLSDAKGLVLGTSTAEWVVRASTEDAAITPTNINARSEGGDGSARVRPIKISKSILFLQRAGEKIKELRFFFDQDGFQPTDLTYISHEITKGGVRQFAYMRDPDPIVWCVRNDGVLAGMTFARSVETVQVTWHRHVLGGFSTAGGAPAKVESACVIPTATGYELWLSVQRYVNGAVVRHVEVMMAPFEPTDFQHNAFFVDAGVSRSTSEIYNIVGATQANPVVISADPHVDYNSGDKIFLGECEGMTEINSKVFEVGSFSTTSFTFTVTIASPAVFTRVAHGLEVDDAVFFTTTGALPTGLAASTFYYVATVPTADTFTVSATRGGAAINTSGSQSGTHTLFTRTGFTLVDENGTAYSAWQQGGRFARRVDAAAGLTHLKGQTVQILGDGGAQEATVTTDASATITLSPASGFLHAGLGYESDLQTLRVEAGGADGPALGKMQKLEEVSLVLDTTGGIKVGRDFGDNLVDQQFRDTGSAMGVAPPLFSGILECENFEGDYSLDNRICIRQDVPLPATVLGILCQVHTEDRQ